MLENIIIMRSKKVVKRWMHVSWKLKTRIDNIYRKLKAVELDSVLEIFKTFGDALSKLNSHIITKIPLAPKKHENESTEL